MGKEPHLKLTIRLCGEAEQRCFGPGMATLLERVREHRSLRAAAASMDMAYSKAWRILRTAEAALGYPLLRSTTGGPHGGGAVLTPEAERLLTFYRQYTAEVEAFAQERFTRTFPQLPEWEDTETP